MKKLFRIVLVSTVSLLSFSCYYDELQEETIPIIAEDVLFATDIQPIFNMNNCMQCHNADRAPDLREGRAYSSLVPTYVIPNNADGSRLYIQLDEGHRGLRTSQLALIRAWINQGALNN
ncbi:MAG: hypothetical protein R6W85_00250 [Gillisia sp.]